LVSLGIPLHDIERHQQSSADVTATPVESHADDSWWDSLKRLFMPEEDTHAYGEGIRRGGVVLVVHVSDTENDDAIDLLERNGAVDLDQRSDEWRSQGWTPGTAASMTSIPESASLGDTADTRGNASTGSTMPMAETRIPIAREELRVGKRDVSRGHVRIRAYVVERPVEEQVALRRETVEVERRPVTGTAAHASQDAFQEKTVELDETQEEAVVSKTPIVEEELVVRKGVEQQTERVSDTIRETKVQVDDDRQQTPGTAAPRGKK
jgi:uncharacterized protein (TIGR02271 family)